MNRHHSSRPSCPEAAQLTLQNLHLIVQGLTTTLDPTGKFPEIVGRIAEVARSTPLWITETVAFTSCLRPSIMVLISSVDSRMRDASGCAELIHHNTLHRAPGFRPSTAPPYL
ncbi:hypothetical protein [Marinobacter sp. es.048]|uniref:hypothetical protein n=1 Tax=Marinobacter sp. es.048 TaxID=1761795 RepID=UPI0015573D39|nr:hypothetical protein [Marinobacter sp. es.048]